MLRRKLLNLEKGKCNPKKKNTILQEGKICRRRNYLSAIGFAKKLRELKT